MKLRLVIFLLLVGLQSIQSKELVWFDGNKPITYTLMSGKNDIVETALQLFEADMKAVTGKSAEQASKGIIEIYQLNQLKDKVFARLERHHLPVSDIITHHDSYAIACHKGRIMVLGSDARGTAYAIMHLSSMAGISPWIWWGDIVPAKKHRLSIDDSIREIVVPSVEWRGLLLNDPQATLSAWSKNTLDNGIEQGEIGPNAWRKLFQLMMRLHLNCLELGTAKEAEAFYSHRKNISTAGECGIEVWANSNIISQAKHGARQEKLPQPAQFTSNENRCEVHLSHKGKQNDWIWLPTASPGLIFNELNMAWNKGVKQLWMAEIHEPKLVAYQLSMFSDMAWDYELLTSSTPESYMKVFFQYHFGKEKAAQIVSLMAEFYRLSTIRKPEYMRSPLPESNKKETIASGLATTFNPGEFGNELGRHVQQWRSLATKAQQLGKQLEKTRQHAYFAWVEYPLTAGMLMAVKELEAQEACQISRKGSFHHDEEALEAAANSIVAYRKIYELTDHFNRQLSKGRWNGLVQIDEKRYPFFSMPTLPDKLSDKEIARYQNDEIYYYPLHNDLFVARNANQYTEIEGSAQAVELTGHSGKAMMIAPGSSLTYEFHTAKQGQAILYTAFVPLPHYGNSMLTYTISIDDGKPVPVKIDLSHDTETALQAAIRGQIVVNQRLQLDKGTHTLTITATEQSLMVDQWFIDFDLNRKFYTFPVQTKQL